MTMSALREFRKPLFVANQRLFQSRMIPSLCEYGWTECDIKLFSFFLSCYLCLFLYDFRSKNKKNMAASLVNWKRASSSSGHASLERLCSINSKFLDHETILFHLVIVLC